jgi:phospholipase C
MTHPRIGLLLTLAALGGCGGTFEPLPNNPAPACTFHAGALPTDTLPAGTPHGAAIPIDHIVVLMQENHSFDNYFGRLPAFGHHDVDGLPAGAANPDSNGTPVSTFHENRYCTADTDHSWTGSHLEFSGGKNDGFVIQNNPDGARAIGYYDQGDLPFYYALAGNFAIGDRYFCSVLGPTFPNRMHLLAGTSFGHIRNDLNPTGFVQPTIFDTLNAHNVSWRVYYNDFSYAGLLFHLSSASRARLVRFTNFMRDAAAGTLPQVSFVDPAMGIVSVEFDEHPPANIQQGQQFAAQVTEAVLDSPTWPRTALFITYDEHGGFYDHVPPPAACPPDDIAPMLDPSDPSSDFPAQFDRYGFRVPLMVVSPYARPGFVSHVIYDHTSILRFIETRFDLPALTNRDANAQPMLDLFDFSHPALLNPPLLSPATVDPVQLQQCRDDFPAMHY